MASQGNIRTLGPRTAELVSRLLAEGKPVYSTKDVERITSLRPELARSLARDLVERKVAVRLKTSLYALVPFEYRNVSDFVPDAYLVAAALVEPYPYYLSHATAMDIHGMTTQPQLVIFTSCTARKKKEVVFGTEYRFVFRTPSAMFGIIQHWIEGGISAAVSDLERTIIDGLTEPQHAGGISEVAKGLLMVRSAVEVERLTDYARRLGVGTVIRRLGYLLELYELAPAAVLDRLRRDLTASNEILDPTLPHEGRFTRRWHLQLNVPSEELLAVAGT